MNDRTALQAIERNAKLWDEKRERLWYAAQLLEDRVLSIREEISRGGENSPHQHKELYQKSLLIEVAAMLRAMAIENLLKAIHYHENPSPRDPKMEGHNLAEFAQRLGLTETSDESWLDQLQWMIYLGRYPVHLKGKQKANGETRVGYCNQPGYATSEGFDEYFYQRYVEVRSAQVNDS